MGFVGDLVDSYLRSRGYRKRSDRPEWMAVEGQDAGFFTGEGWNRRADEALAMRTSWVYSDINMIARECSQARLNVLQDKGEEVEEITNHPFEILMRQPNPFMTRSFLMQYTVGWLKLDGNSYWYLMPGLDGVAEIWPLPADKVEPKPSKERGKYLDGYVYRASGRQWTIPPEFIAHFRQWNYVNIYKGMSDIQAMQLAIKGDEAMQQWNYNFFGKKNAIPTTVMSLPQDTPPGDFELIKDEIISEFGGTKRRTMVTRAGDITVATIGLSQKDLDFLAGREFNREEIDRVYGIPAAVWAKDATRANAMAADKTLKDKTIWPLLVYLSEEITLQVMIPYYGEALLAAFEDIRPEDRGLRVAEAKTYGPALTVNEYRTEYLKAPPLEDERGESLMAELLKGPAMSEPVMPAKSTDINGDLKRWRSVAVRLFRKEKDPAEYEFNSEIIPEALKSRILEALAGAETEEEVRAAFAVPFRLVETGELKRRIADPAPAWKGQTSPFDKLREAWEPKVAEALLKVWKAEAKRFLERFQSQAQMAAQPVKALVEDILDDKPFWEEHVKVQVQVMIPLLEEAIEQAGRLGIDLLDTELGLGFDWTLVNEEALRWAREYAGRLIKEITPTTRQAIGETVANWIESGEPMKDLAKRIQTIYEDPARAQLIATTEATDAYKEGNRLVWKKTEVVDGYEWRTANDEMVCKLICRPLHKQRRDLEEPYVIPSGKLKGETRDGPAGHPGCRCWEAPVVMGS